jgi:RNA methyltransferase, TrmH family
VSALAFTNPRVQRLRRLLGRRSFRVSEGVFVVEGAKVLAEAFAAGASVSELYVLAGTADSVVSLARSLGVPVYDLLPDVLARVTDTVTPQSVLGVVRSVDVPLSTLQASLLDGGFCVVAVGLSDPGNAGTVMRSAEGAGACGVVFCDGSVDVTNPKTVRSSAGSMFHVPVVQSDLSGEDVVSTLRAWGVRVWATSSVVAGGVAYDAADLRGPTAIVLGNEANGLSSAVLEGVDGLITIPTAGRTESLNVAMAASVLAFEAARQRRSVR